MERLGWFSRCARSTCPQEWLTRSVRELPGTLRCSACRETIHLVKTQTAFEGAVGSAAYPVMPPIALPRTGELEPLAGEAEVAAGGLSTADLPQATPVEALPRSASPAARPRWFVQLDSGGEPIHIDKDKMVIGRSRSCDIIVPSGKVSRQHAQLVWVRNDLYIEDLGSANGVWRNGERLERSRLSDGDIVVLSDETLHFRQA